MIHNEWLIGKGFKVVDYYNGERFVSKSGYTFSNGVTYMFDDMTENTMGPRFEFYLRSDVCLEVIYLAREGI